MSAAFRDVTVQTESQKESNSTRNETHDIATRNEKNVGRETRRASNYALALEND